MQAVRPGLALFLQASNLETCGDGRFLRAFAETPCGDLAAGVGVLEWLPPPFLGLAGCSLGLGEILAEGVEEGKCAPACVSQVPFGGARAPCLPELLGVCTQEGPAWPLEASVSPEKSPRGSG